MLPASQRPLGRTGLRTTFIGFGALEIGRDWGVGTPDEQKRPDELAARGTLQAVLDLGINLIDTASAYHRSEDRIGKFLHDRRSEFILATKCGEHNNEPHTYYDFSYPAVRRSIENSCRLLQTDVLDILQIHFGPDPEKVLDEGGCVRAMKEAKTKGLVRFLGASVDGSILDRCIDSGDFDVVQVGYSLTNQDEGDRITKALHAGIGVLIRSGLGRGWLTSRALRVSREERPPKVNALFELCKGDTDLLTSLALHFLARHEGVSSVLVGSKSGDNLRKALESMLSPVDDTVLDEAVRIGQTP